MFGPALFRKTLKKQSPGVKIIQIVEPGSVEEKHSKNKAPGITTLKWSSPCAKKSKNKSRREIPKILNVGPGSVQENIEKQRG